MKRTARGSGFEKLEKIEAVRFTNEQVAQINSVARELRIPRAEAIRRATALGLPLVRAALKVFAEV